MVWGEIVRKLTRLKALRIGTWCDSLLVTMWGTSCGGSKSGEIKPGDNFSSVGRGKQKQKYACYNFEYFIFTSPRLSTFTWSRLPGEMGQGSRSPSLISHLLTEFIIYYLPSPGPKWFRLFHVHEARKTRNLSPVDSCQSWAAGYGEGAWGEKKSGQVCYSTCSTSLTSKHLVPQRSLASE